jgi:hypothetical protein
VAGGLVHNDGNHHAAQDAYPRNWGAIKDAKWWKKDAGAPPERVIQLPPEWPRKSGKVRPLNAPAANA